MSSAKPHQCLYKLCTCTTDKLSVFIIIINNVFLFVAYVELDGFGGVKSCGVAYESLQKIAGQLY